MLPSDSYVRELVAVGAEIMGITVEEALSSRAYEPASVRAAVSCVLREQSWLVVTVGKALRRHHTTITYHWTLHEARMGCDPEYRYLVEHLRAAAIYKRPVEMVLDRGIDVQIAELEHALAAAQRLRVELLEGAR